MEPLTLFTIQQQPAAAEIEFDLPERLPNLYYFGMTFVCYMLLRPIAPTHRNGCAKWTFGLMNYGAGIQNLFGIEIDQQDRMRFVMCAEGSEAHAEWLEKVNSPFSSRVSRAAKAINADMDSFRAIMLAYAESQVLLYRGGAIRADLQGRI